MNGRGMKLFVATLLLAVSSAAARSQVPPSEPAPPAPPSPEVINPEPVEPDFPVPSDECSEDEDCPAYNYCFYSYWVGASCNSNMAGDHSGKTSCSKLAADGETQILDHQVCMEAEAKNSFNDDEIQYATSRCFAELGYKCAKSYYMPCNANYDQEGKVVAGEEESCPTNFKCTTVSYASDGNKKVCIPVQPDYTRDISEGESECETNFDCGYSDLEDRWTTCAGFTFEKDGEQVSVKNCQRVVEKK